VEKYGLKAVNREKFAARGKLERKELERLIDMGLSVAEIARRVDRSGSNVRHWLRRYGLRTRATIERRARREARAAGRATAVAHCRHHGESVFVLEARGYYRCIRCRSAAVSKRRRVVKARLVLEAGGRCQLCGYDRYMGALQFHHLDPAAKEFSVSYQGMSPSINRLRAEAGKCILLCSNCHAEVEGNYIPLSGSPPYSIPG
jgi:transposase-like protein